MFNESFFRYLQFEKRFSPHTLTAYKGDLTSFSEYIKVQFELDDINNVSHSFIRSWIVFLMDTGMKSKSINRKISTLKSYYRFLQREGLISQSPMNKVISPKVPKRLPQFVEQSNMDMLLNDVDIEPGFIGIRNRLIIELFYATGMRLAELISLKDIDVNSSNLQLKVLGKRNKERIIPISEHLLEIMNAYSEEKNKNGISSDFYFCKEDGSALYTKYVYRLVKEELTKVTTLQKKSPHILRHTFATHMLNNGAELNAIKEILGHSSLAATQVYTHNSIEKLKNIYKQAHPKG